MRATAGSNLYQATFLEFAEATYRHLGCVECASGAWCRDFDLVDSGAECAYRCHKHELSDCKPRKETGR